MSRPTFHRCAPWLIATVATLTAAQAGLAGTTVAETDGPKSRMQVRSELDAAIRDGTFASMRHNRSYPQQWDAAWHRLGGAATNLHGSGEIAFDAPAAGVRSREEVQAELQRAREDGSLRRLNSDREY